MGALLERGALTRNPAAAHNEIVTFALPFPIVITVVGVPGWL